MTKRFLALLLALLMAFSVVSVAAADPDESTCSHSHTNTEEDFYNWDEVEYEEVDDSYHAVTGHGHRYTYCLECGDMLSDEDLETLTLQYRHEYDDNGVCKQCKHTCTHTNTWQGHTCYEDQLTFESNNDGTHTVTGPRTVGTFCEDCGKELDVVEVPDDEWVEGHNYNEEGYCYQCGHTCQHRNSWSEYDYGDTPYKIEDTGDDKYHTLSGEAYTYTYCPDCGRRTNVTHHDNLVRQEQHYYDENGVCTLCGHTNACQHEHTYQDWTWVNWDDVEYEPKDDQTHTATGYG